MSFCSSCGTERQPKASVCQRCKKDFRYLTEVNAYPFMLCLRRRIFRELNPSPTGSITYTEVNISVEVFEAMFSKYGKSRAIFDSSSNNSSPSPSPTSPLASTSTAPFGSTPAHSLSRVIWKKSDLDSICKFQSVDPSRGFGAALLLSEALGCAAVIPPMMVSHASYKNGDQKMTVKFSYAFMNAGSKIFQPPDHCLDLEVWGAPLVLGDPQGYIVDVMAGYPSELKHSGIQVPELVMSSAAAVLHSRAPMSDPQEDEASKLALEKWAAKSKSSNPLQLKPTRIGRTGSGSSTASSNPSTSTSMATTRRF